MSPPFDVLVLGPYPPPLGGVSIYVRRLYRALTAMGMRIGIANHFSTSRDSPEVVACLRRNALSYCWCLLRIRSKIVHYHHSRLSLLIATACVAELDRRPYVVTLHGRTIVRSLQSRAPFVAWSTRWSLRRFDEVVAVSRELADALVDIVPAERVTVIPAFLPPLDDEIASTTVHPSVDAALTEGRPAFVAAAYRISLKPEGGDIYGLDLAAEAVETIAARGYAPTLTLFVALPLRSPEERDYLRALGARVARATGREFVVRFGESLLPALARDVIYLRPTRADGDAVSIREALTLGVPVIASDIVVRPEGVALFALGDAGGFVEAITGVLSDTQRQKRVPETDTQALLEPMRAVYERQLQRATVAGGPS